MATITDDAIHRLLSRFGTPSHLSRNHHCAFAHVSLACSSPADVDRCIIALNSTSWCGTKLRVQHAKEHFLLRLQREWQEADEDVRLKALSCDHQQPRTSASHFTGVKKGNHKFFSFPDLEMAEQSVPTFSEEAAKLPHASDEPLRSIDGTKIQDIPTKPQTENKLDSTLQLFGLVPGAGSSEGLPPSSKAKLSKHQLTNTSQQPLKRPRRTTLQLADVQAMEKDPSLVNMQVERRAALSVLASMFPNSALTPNVHHVPTEKDIAANRRAALYRKLDLRPDALPAQKMTFVKRKSVVPKKALSSQPISRNWESECQQPLRRAGLYKKLQAMFD